MNNTTGEDLTVSSSWCLASWVSHLRAVGKYWVRRTARVSYKCPSAQRVVVSSPYFTHRRVDEVPEHFESGWPLADVECRVSESGRKESMMRGHVLITPPHSTLPATFATASDTTTGDRPHISFSSWS